MPPRKKQEPPERIILAMPAKLIQRIDEYRWRARIASRAAAIRALLEIGLRHVEPRTPKKPSDDQGGGTPD